ACLDNIQGARDLPKHPLVDQAMRDCLEQAMDLPQLVQVLQRVFAGEIRCVAKDTPEPSVFCNEILNSAVYTFLDDAPLEERRTRAVYTRRTTEPRSADDLGALDPAAIERVRAEACPRADRGARAGDRARARRFARPSGHGAYRRHAARPGERREAPARPVHWRRRPARVVRPQAACAHPPLHAQPAARGDRAG